MEKLGSMALSLHFRTYKQTLGSGQMEAHSNGVKYYPWLFLTLCCIYVASVDKEESCIYSTGIIMF